MLELFEVGFDIILQSALDSKYRNSWHPCQTTQSGYIWLNPLSFSSTPTMMLVGRCPKQPSPQTSLCRTFPRLSDLFRFIYFQSASFLAANQYTWSSHLSLWVAHQGSCNLGLFVVVVVRLLLVQTTFGIMSTHFKLSVLCPPFWSSQVLWTRPASSWGAYSLFHNHFPSPPPSCQASPCQTPRLCSVGTCSHWTCAVLRVSVAQGNCCVNTFEIPHLRYVTM